MNNNIDLTKILKDCPKGWKFYTPVWGEVTFIEIKKNKDCLYPICIYTNTSSSCTNLTKDGRYLINRTGTECILFPSKEQRDWSKFTAPWYKKERFDPTTLNPFDKVLVKVSNESFNTWYADFVAEPTHVKNETPLILGAKEANMVIPYNDETKYLVGTKDEAPEYYRYWED